jgi:hypothetical protein
MAILPLCNNFTYCGPMSQEAMQNLFWETDRPKIRVVVVHRKDAGTRSVSNHDDMIRKLQQDLPADVDVR